MREYCRSKNACLRKLLLQHFGFENDDKRQLHSCCDVCQQLCICAACQRQKPVLGNTEDMDVDERKVRNVSEESRHKLQSELEDYRLHIGSMHKKRYGGIDSVTGLTSKLIEDIVKNSDFIEDVDYLMEHFEFWFQEYAEDVYQIISKYN